MRRLMILAAAALLVGTAAEARPRFAPDLIDKLQPGQTAAEIVEKLGKPNVRVTGPNGGQAMTWIAARQNAWSGSVKSRSVALLFDSDARFVRVLAETDTRVP